MTDHLSAQTRQMIENIDVQDAPHEPEFKPGDDFGRYVIRRFIGSGGMAEVYEAEHVGLRKRVAIKVLTRELAKNPVVKPRFLREGERAARIRHPHVVDITDVGECAGLPYIVMEYLDGENFGDMILREAPLDLEQLVNIMLPVMSAVSAGHREGVIHRDLKPDNIFLHYDGNRVRPKVLDFGVSRSLAEREVRERLTVPNAVLGTPQYMAPEQARGEDCDERADQYTLALVIYEAVTNELPRDGDTLLQLLNAAASGKLVPPSRHVPGLSKDFEAALMRALEPNVEARFDQLADFAETLMPFASQRAGEYWRQEFQRQSEELTRSYDNLSLESAPGLPPSNRPSAPSPRTNSPSLGGRTVPILPTTNGAQQTMDSNGASAVASTSNGTESRVTIQGTSNTLDQQPRGRWSWGILLAAVAAASVTAFGVVSLRSADNPAPTAATAPVQNATAPKTSDVSPPGSVIPAKMPLAMKISVSPKAAKIYMDDALLSTGDFTGKLPADGRTFKIRVEANGHASQVKVVEATDDVSLVFVLERHHSATHRGMTPEPAEATPPTSAPAAPPTSDFTRRGKRKPGKSLDKNNPYK